MRKSFCLLAVLAGLSPSATAMAAQPTTKPSTAAARAPRFTLDTPLKDIAADPKGRVFMDRRVPGLVGSPHFFLLRGKSLRQLAADPHARGFSAATLKTMEAELAAVR